MTLLCRLNMLHGKQRVCLQSNLSKLIFEIEIELKRPIKSYVDLMARNACFIKEIEINIDGLRLCVMSGQAFAYYNYLQYMISEMKLQNKFCLTFVCERISRPIIDLFITPETEKKNIYNDRIHLKNLVKKFNITVYQNNITE